ncbi:MAG TPA: serine hydrolase, partial [Bdellovibrionales bacterium]|nr:serine hydrolase [Bdellovibrionales bacterium]
GSGQTNWIEPGQSVSLHYLMEQMMIESDNAATDILIDLVGLETLNQNIREYIPSGLSYITSLLMVRIMGFGEMHPKAKSLTNHDFITLKKVKDEREKAKKLAELIGVGFKELKVQSVHEAFERYYDRGLNSATLTSYGELLEKIALGKVLTPERSQEMVDLMRRCFTGKDRLVAGLSKKYKFAHKTGTQVRRACDMGIVSVADKSGAKSKSVVLAVCTQKFKSPSASDEVFRKIGEAFSDSGVMEEPGLTRAPTGQ